MRRVSQRKLVQGDEHGVMIPNSPGGDCFPACVASIFEIPLDQAPGDRGNTQHVRAWLALNFPGIGLGRAFSCSRARFCASSVRASQEAMRLIAELVASRKARRD